MKFNSSFVHTKKLEIAELDVKLQHDPFNAMLLQKHKFLSDDLSKDLHREELDFRQKSSIKWLDVGGANTVYFHNSFRIRHVKQTIRSLKTQDNEFVTERDDIARQATLYFQNLWSDSSPVSDFTPVPKKKLTSSAKIA